MSDESAQVGVDRRRVRSYAGLVVGRLGPRAYGPVAGIFLTLLVAERTDSLFLVTFALTAGRFVTWAAYPVVGRWSDAADTRVGRRTPFMAGGLLVLAACTYAYPVVDGYWGLVALIVAARLARVFYGLPSAVATPEIFGGSRWVRAAVNVWAAGLVVGVSIRLTVVATWEADDASTWRPAYWLAATFIATAGLAILLLVREAPAAKAVARRRADGSWRQRFGEVLAQPNARVLLAAGLLSIMAAGFTERAFPIYAKQILGAGADDLAVADLVALPLGVATSIPIGYWLSRRLHRRTIAVLAALVGAGYSFAHLFLTHLWQSIGLGIVAGPFLVAVGIALAPLALQLVPRSGGVAERIGLFAGPVALAGLLANYVAAFAYDAVVHDYRVIWALSGAFGLATAVVLLGLRVPAGRQRADVRRAFREIRRAFAQNRSGGRGLFAGEVTREDADTAALLELLQRTLDPYAELEEIREARAPVAEAVFPVEERADLEDR